MVYSWVKIQNGNIPDFEVMYKESVEKIYAFNVRKTGDAHLAEDITASAFEILWKEKKRFQISDGECLKLLYGISKNLIKNGVRKTKKDIKMSTMISLEKDIDFADSICDSSVNKQKVQAIEEKLLALSEKDQETYKMVFIEEKSYKEISMILGIPIGTVKSRISKIKSKLR